MNFSVSWLASQTHYGDGSGEGEAFEFGSKIQVVEARFIFSRPTYIK
jgi:hypothetical protein